jgi:flagellar hook-basal body complex protein FliE
MGLLSDVNTKLEDSDQNVRDLAMGKTNNLDKVVTSVEEANLALEYTIAIRGKLLDAYNEVARITV